MKDSGNKKFGINKQSGQATLEWILLFSVVLVVWGAVSKGLQDPNFFQQIFGDPWTRLRTTIEFGVPAASYREAAAKHPGGLQRHSTKLPTP